MCVLVRVCVCVSVLLWDLVAPVALFALVAPVDPVDLLPWLTSLPWLPLLPWLPWTSGSHLELVLAVPGSSVEGSVVAEAADVVDAVEALDPLGDSLHPQDSCGLRHRRDAVDLQVCSTSGLGFNLQGSEVTGGESSLH